MAVIEQTRLRVPYDFACRLAVPTVLALLTGLATPTRSDNLSPFVAASRDKTVLEAAIAAERPHFTPPRGVTGITVPHHLLAADLVARGFWAASANRYDRILLISPDHFRKVKGPFAIDRDDLMTVFGPVHADTAAADALLVRPDLFEQARDVANEHGVMSIVPFIRWFFPDTPVLAILASPNAPVATWEDGAKALKSAVTDRTLIIQSTDYSHYLPLADAIQRDQESLATIAARDPGAVGRLLQPSHMDSLAAQYLQLALQGRQLGGKPVIVANRNSAQYGADTESTTSYIVTVFLRNPDAASALSYSDQERVFFAGDTLLGRFFALILRDEKALQIIAETVLAATGGAPLILNLEGVLLDEPLVGQESRAHIMQSETAIPLLKRLHVVAASLANNHSQDLGVEGFDESRATLSRHDVAPLIHGVIADLGSFRILPLTFHRGKYLSPGVIETPADLSAACARDADPPLVALVHWGMEYSDSATEAQRNAALVLNACGIPLVVGAHSHQASTGIESLVGGAVQVVFSLGNFLFDQRGERSGALLEMRRFRQGTIGARLVPIPNLFEIGARQQELGTPRPAPHLPVDLRMTAGRTYSN